MTSSEAFDTPSDPTKLAALLKDLALAKEALALARARGGDTGFANGFLLRVQSDIEALRLHPAVVSPLDVRPAVRTPGMPSVLTRPQLRVVFDAYATCGDGGGPAAVHGDGRPTVLPRANFEALCLDCPGLLTPSFDVSNVGAAWDAVMYEMREMGATECDFDVFLGMLLQLARSRFLRLAPPQSPSRRADKLMASDSTALRQLLTNHVRHVHAALLNRKST